MDKSKNQLARELAQALAVHADDDAKLRSLVKSQGLQWTDFQGPAATRLFDVLCSVSPDQVRAMAEQLWTGDGKQAIRQHLEPLLEVFLAAPGSIFRDKVTDEFKATCPYPGMRWIKEAKRLYGREQLTAQIIEQVSTSTLFFVQGASGCGKSSLLWAGGAPAWRERYGADSVLAVRMQRDPFRSLASALETGLDFEQALADTYRQPENRVFTRLAEALKSQRTTPLLLILDQFEQALVAENEESQRSLKLFLDGLVELTKTRPTSLRLLVSLRSDFWGRFEAFPELLAWADRHFVRVQTLDRGALEEAILRPAADHGVVLDEAIVADLVKEVAGRSGLLPLMQDVLVRLWNEELQRGLAQSKRLHADTYQGLGGVLGALKEKLNGFVKQDQAAMQRILLRTVQVGRDPQQPVISRVGRLSQLSPDDRRMAAQLIEARVLATWDGGSPEDENDGYVLPHETLIQRWEPLCEWIAADRRSLFLIQMLESAASTWHDRRSVATSTEQSAQVDQGYCWRGGQLEDAERLAKADFPRLGFTPDAITSEFLRESRKRDDDELLRELRLSREKVETASKLAESERQRAEDAERHQGSLQRTLRSLSRWTVAAAVLACLALIGVGVAIVARSQTLSALGDTKILLAEAERQLGVVKLAEASRLIHDKQFESATEALGRIDPKYRVDGDGKPDYVWHYLKHQTVGGLFGVYGHTGGITSVKCSPDALKIVTGSSDGTARVWDARTGQPIRIAEADFVLSGHSDEITDVIFSPDETQIATASLDRTVKVWSARTAQLLFTLRGDMGKVISIAYSPDGKRIITGSDDKLARIWDAWNGKLVYKLGGHVDKVSSVFFSPDGEWIVTGSGDALRRYDARTYTLGLIHNCPGVRDSFVASTCSPDATQVATASTDNTVYLWNARTFEPLSELRGHTARVSSVAYSPDGLWIVTGSWDQTVRIWDSRTGQSVAVVGGFAKGNICAAFTADGLRFVAGAANNCARVWDVRSGQRITEISLGRDPVTSIAHSPDGKLLAVSSGGYARVYDKRTGQVEYDGMGYYRQIYSVAFAPDGNRIALGCVDNACLIHDMKAGKDLRLSVSPAKQQVLGLQLGVKSVSFSRSGEHLVTGADDNSVILWNTSTGQEIVSLRGHIAGVNSVVFAIDGTRVATASDDSTAIIWDLRSEKPKAILKNHAGVVTGIAYSPCGTKIATASYDQTVCVWDAHTCRPIRVLDGHSAAITSLAFSPDGRRLVTGADDHTACVWDVQTGQLVVVLNGHSARITDVEFAPDGQEIVTASDDGTIRIWEAWSDTAVENASSNSTEYTPVRLTEMAISRRRWMTAPKPEYHRKLAWDYDASGRLYAALVQNAILVNSLGQQALDRNDHDQAVVFFSRALVLRRRIRLGLSGTVDALEAMDALGTPMAAP